MLEDVREPLHMVLRWNPAIAYPNCPWAASSLAADYLRDAGYDAEVVPLLRVTEAQGRLLLGLSPLERDPERVRALLGRDFVELLPGLAHQAVGVKLRQGGEVRFYLADYMLPQLFGRGGSDRDLVFAEAEGEILLMDYGLVMVSPKFVRCQSAECWWFFIDGGRVALDLSDDYAAFKRLADAKRRGF
jgi:hypothetical protein